MGVVWVEGVCREGWIHISGQSEGGGSPSNPLRDFGSLYTALIVS